MSIDEQRRILLERRAIEALKARIARESYLSVREVSERLNLSREKVEGLPMEVLPYADHGSGPRAYRRYHPADVMAVDARLRAWKAAQARGAGEAYLRELRAELEARDAAAIEAARAAHEAVA